VSWRIALLEFITTVKLLAIVGVLGLGPTVHEIEEAVNAVTLQLTPSMVMMGLPVAWR
jgi:hypothetical protein